MDEKKEGRSAPGHSQGGKARRPAGDGARALRADPPLLPRRHRPRQPSGDPPSPERDVRLLRPAAAGEGAEQRWDEKERRDSTCEAEPPLAPRASCSGAAPRSRGEGSRCPPAPQLQPGIGGTRGPAASSSSSLRRAGDESEPRGCGADPPLSSRSSPGLQPPRRWRGSSPERRQLPAPFFPPPPRSPTRRPPNPLGPLPAPPRVGGPGAVTGGRTPQAPPLSRLLALPLPGPSPQAVAPTPAPGPPRPPLARERGLLLLLLLRCPRAPAPPHSPGAARGTCPLLTRYLPADTPGLGRLRSCAVTAVTDGGDPERSIQRAGRVRITQAFCSLILKTTWLQLGSKQA
ncbi:basic salivary proline-rich protein 1-like isoform X2 [Heliangelus exortis]|uniref:basic salivary proline-rich protein 1-like isoform X2 n=1 Tax=Heliangelus exortis TaxID=472823 RepID=UPI003A915174